MILRVAAENSARCAILADSYICPVFADLGLSLRGMGKNTSDADGANGAPLSLNEGSTRLTTMFLLTSGDQPLQRFSAGSSR